MNSRLPAGAPPPPPPPPSSRRCVARKDAPGGGARMKIAAGGAGASASALAAEIAEELQGMSSRTRSCPCRGGGGTSAKEKVAATKSRRQRRKKSADNANAAAAAEKVRHLLDGLSLQEGDDVGDNVAAASPRTAVLRELSQSRSALESLLRLCCSGSGSSGGASASTGEGEGNTAAEEEEEDGARRLRRFAVGVLYDLSDGGPALWRVKVASLAAAMPGENGVGKCGVGGCCTSGTCSFASAAIGVFGRLLEERRRRLRRCAAGRQNRNASSRNRRGASGDDQDDAEEEIRVWSLLSRAVTMTKASPLCTLRRFDGAADWVRVFDQCGIEDGLDGTGDRLLDAAASLFFRVHTLVAISTLREDPDNPEALNFLRRIGGCRSLFRSLLRRAARVERPLQDQLGTSVVATMKVVATVGVIGSFLHAFLNCLAPPPQFGGDGGDDGEEESTSLLVRHAHAVLVLAIRRAENTEAVLRPLFRAVRATSGEWLRLIEPQGWEALLKESDEERRERCLPLLSQPQIYRDTAHAPGGTGTGGKECVRAAAAPASLATTISPRKLARKLAEAGSRDAGLEFCANCHRTEREREDGEDCEGQGGGPRGPLFVCRGCHRARYCSARCQREHWTHHKRECGMISVPNNDNNNNNNGPQRPTQAEAQVRRDAVYGTTK